MMSILFKGESIEQQRATNLSSHYAIISKLCYRSAFVTRGCGSKACNVSVDHACDHLYLDRLL